MLYEIISIFFISISPLGEARVGIPYGLVNEVPLILSFSVACGANLLVFPLFYEVISKLNYFFWKNRTYKKGAVYLSKRAKRKTKSSIDKYGAWGLMVFVMIPLPVTGAYIGTIAVYIFNISYRSAFYAISVGVVISSILVSIAGYYSNLLI
ncbi:MAG: small multi-drug export protein [Vicingus serpentipes]|nr:small multi-drug export protein [Vicingus serpentipes]